VGHPVPKEIFGVSAAKRKQREERELELPSMLRSMESDLNAMAIDSRPAKMVRASW